MSSISCTKLTLLSIGAIAIQFIGLSIFVFGFFPVKPLLTGHSGSESYRRPTCDNDGAAANQSDATLSPDRLRLLYQEESEIPPLYDRLVLMVIDGLPAEFVLGKKGQPPSKVFMEAMPYTQSLLTSGMAVGYHAVAAAPTVTMPRLKAMVSGAIGGFLDVAFNFNTQAYLDDNLVAQFFKIGWKMVMHGDDTWLRLFPGVFERHDGVSSFFVKDIVQVDQNVSRHLDEEHSRDDWNFLILHYLGLDHVGHIGGRNSVLMAPKLSEMDEVVKMIHINTLRNLENDQGKTLLVVVSDHGMTENGNHGGSSYEETDSIALFIGPKTYASDHSSSNHDTIFQVDIAATIALLFGVPIPKNNIGVLISQMIDSMTDDQKLRALQLNSWQLFRLLKAELPGLSCRNFPCDAFVTNSGPTINECKGSKEKLFCCLYLNAATLHDAWKAKVVTSLNSTEGYKSIVAAYHEFLSSASEWLSHKATDKPINLLVLGVAALIISCLILLGVVFVIHKEVPAWETHDHDNYAKPWKIDEVFILFGILILVISMGSSSMIEEEHYIWHFLTSTVNLLFFRKAIQSLDLNKAHDFLSSIREQKDTSVSQISSLFLILFSGRILRGWHQGGVNWTNLPDISKWLEQAGNQYINLIQIASCAMVIILGIFVLFLMQSKTSVLTVIGFSLFMFGLLVLQHFTKHQDMSASFNKDANLSVQIFYAVLGITTFAVVLILPWIMPMQTPEICSGKNLYTSASIPVEIQDTTPILVMKDSLYIIGCFYITSWCLLQLLLQQSINAMPVLLLFIQFLASMLTFSSNGSCHKQWVEITALYNLGMAGHFALGNSNTLATIDVAGAFIGISSHSTFLSGLLMFIITYASPMLFFLSMVMYISVKATTYPLVIRNGNSGEILKTLLGFPCLVPLTINSVLLTVYTIVLLLMRNHLFIWSVFSPKYLYVCAATACVYIGVCIVVATVIHTYIVLFWLRKSFSGGNKEKASNTKHTEMDPHRGSEPENPIATCLSMLSLRRFSACRDFARRLPPSDSVSRVLAVADVLSAANFYSVLQLLPSDAGNRDLARRQYAKLALLLDPTIPDKLPFSDEALARVQEAWHVLSHPERRALLHDREKGLNANSTTSFWTACPYCWNLFEYEKKYEDCALLCQVCGKAFQGVAVKPPTKNGDAVVEGDEFRQYYTYEASVQLMYYEVKNDGYKGNNVLGAQFVYISSDDDDDDGSFVRNEGLQGNAEKRKMRVKTVATRVGGNRMRRNLDSDLDLDVDDGELEFTEGDDDVFVGVRFDK